MDDEKIIELKITKKEEPVVPKVPSLHTNPILQKMLSFSNDEKKQKFRFKDWFR